MPKLSAELFAFDRSLPRAPFAVELLAFDRLSARTIDVDGRLHVESCNISKATVNPYLGREIPGGSELGLDPEKVYKLFRDPQELAKAAPTFARLQLLDLHTPVSADDPKTDKTCGTIGSDVRFEYPFLKASLAVWTQEAIDLISARDQAELSCSYRYIVDMTPGVSSEGVAYDGVMRDIVGNHVALVREGRAGPEVCVADSLPLEFQPMRHANVINFFKPFLKPGTDYLALDKALDRKAKDEEDEPDREEAMDAREEELDKREEAHDCSTDSAYTEEMKGDRKKARDSRKSARDKRASDRKRGKDSDPVLEKEELKLKGGAQDIALAVDAALKNGKYVSREEAQRLANDAVAARDALDKAYRDVAPLVGQINTAMDSAEAVYRFALETIKVPSKDIHATGLSAVVAAEIRARRNSAPVHAYDAVNGEFSIDAIFKVA